ncbi:hypothetical protein STEG23_011324 [Scotinomys teguina]
MTVTTLGRDQDCSLKNREPDVLGPWFLDPGGWSKTATVSLYFIFPGIYTLSLAWKTQFWAKLLLSFHSRSVKYFQVLQPCDLVLPTCVRSYEHCLWTLFSRLRQSPARGDSSIRLYKLTRFQLMAGGSRCCHEIHVEKNCKVNAFHQLIAAFFNIRIITISLEHKTRLRISQLPLYTLSFYSSLELSTLFLASLPSGTELPFLSLPELTDSFTL